MRHMEGDEHYLKISGPLLIRFGSDGVLKIFEENDHRQSTEWRECSILTLSTSHLVSVQDKGSKIQCGKLGASKITPNDCLHQEYLTINLGCTSD